MPLCCILSVFGVAFYLSWELFFEPCLLGWAVQKTTLSSAVNGEIIYEIGQEGKMAFLPYLTMQFNYH